MKRKRDISDLIRDNQHKLNERPSPRAWRKLESRLDQQANNNRSFLYKQFTMVAAVVVLVAIISLLPFTNRQNKEMAVAENAKSDWDWSAQNLETVYTDDTKNMRQVMEFKRHLKDRYTNTIEEGTQAKKLLASNQIPKDAINRSPSKNNLEVITTDETEAEINERESIVMDQNERAESFSFSRKESTTKKENQRWNWLIGEWSENNNKTTWKKLNERSVFSEDYMIKEDENQFVFIINSASKFPYQLVSSNLFLNVFENKNQDQVIVKRIDNNSFTITIIEKNTGKRLVRKFEK